MRNFLKVIGLLVIIGSSLVVIFWEKGSYGLAPSKGTCYGFIASSEVVAYNFPDAQVSFTILDRTFIYSINNTEKMAYCLGHQME